MRVKDRWGLPTQRYLLLAMREFYRPLRNAIPKENTNPREQFEHLFHIGKIRYTEGVFVGEIPAEISLYLKQLGAAWDYRLRGWRLPLALMNPRVTEMVEAKRKKDTEIYAALLGVLAISPNIVDAFLSGPDLAGQAAAVVERAVSQAVTPMVRGAPFDSRVRDAMQRWAQAEAEKIAVEASAIVKRGGDLSDFLAKREEVSQYRAKVIARRETAVEANNAFAAANIAEGREYYQWVTRGDEIVRPDHADLDRTIQRWDDPPIVNTRTGMRAHPSEDFNCRCIAIPVEN